MPRNNAMSAATSSVKCALMNYLILSQMAMVIAGLASSGFASSYSIDAASDAIGAIPLAISSVLLLHALVKLLRFLRRLKQKWLKR
jgi:hypothetical protein